MPCINIPDFPSLPDITPISLTPPALPPLDLSINYCCRLNLLDFAGYVPIPPVTIFSPTATAIIIAINQVIDQVNNLKRRIPLDCPRQ